jgi:hypothetical protein
MLWVTIISPLDSHLPPSEQRKQLEIQDRHRKSSATFPNETVDEALSLAPSDDEASIDFTQVKEGQIEHVSKDRTEAESSLMAVSTNKQAHDQSISKDEYQLLTLAGSDVGEATRSLDEKAPSVLLYVATTGKSSDPCTKPRLRSDPLAGKSDRKGIVPPIVAVWSRGTLASKSSRHRLWEWLEMTGRDSRLPQYREIVERLYMEVFKHMVDDREKRKAAERAEIAKAMQVKQPATDAPATATPEKPDGTHMETGGKRKLLGNGRVDPKVPSKKLKIAATSSTDLPKVEHQPGAQTEDEMPYSFDGNGDEVLHSHTEIDEDMQRLSEGDTAKSNIATVRQDLEDVVNAALDSLHFSRNNTDRARNKVFSPLNQPHRYFEYADRNPQLILQGDDGKPIFDYQTQITVAKVLKGRKELLAHMQIGSIRKRDPPFREARKMFEKNCRFLKTRISNAIKVNENDCKTISKDLVNELFTQGIAGGEI